MSVAQSMEPLGLWMPAHWRNPIQLIDLGLEEDHDLSSAGRLELCLLVLKHIYDHDFMRTLKRLKTEIRKVDTEKVGSVFLEVMFRYIVQVTTLSSKNEFKDYVMETLSEATGERVMTLAEQWMQDGAEKARLEIAGKLLRNGFSPSVIAENTGLTLDAVDALAFELEVTV